MLNVDYDYQVRVRRKTSLSKHGDLHESNKGKNGTALF